MNRVLRLFFLVVCLVGHINSALCSGVGNSNLSATCPLPTGILYGEMVRFPLYQRNSGGGIYYSNQSVFLAFNDSASTETLTILPQRKMIVGPGAMGVAGVSQITEMLDSGQKLVKWSSYFRNSASLYPMLSCSVDRSFLLIAPTCLMMQNSNSRTLSKPLPIHDPNAILPDNANQLSSLTGIFLDGDEASRLSDKQIAALDLWVANGGILFLDPDSLKALKGRAFLRGATVGEDAPQQVDLALWRKTVESLVTWGPPATATTLLNPYGGGYGYGYGSYGAYGVPIKVMNQKAKTAPASAPASRPIKPTAFASISRLSVPGDPTLQTIGAPTVLAAWRHGEGVVSVQAFRGVGDETLMRNWVALQLSRHLLTREYVQDLTVIDMREDLLGVQPSGRGGLLDEVARPVRVALGVPRLRRQWTILLCLPAALLLVHLVFRFNRRLRWRHGLVALALAGALVLGLTMVFPFGEELLIGRSEVLAPLPGTTHEGHALKVSALRIGSIRQPANELKIGQYPLWSIQDYTMPYSKGLKVGDDKISPFVDAKTPPEGLFAPDELGRRAQSQNNTSLQYVEKGSSGEVQLVIEKNTPSEFRGTLVNETKFDLGDAFVVLRVKDGWIHLNFPKTFGLKARHSFSCAYGDPSQKSKKETATNCAFFSKNDVALKTAQFRTAFDFRQTTWRGFSVSNFPFQPSTGFIVADLTESLADSPAVVFQEKPAREFKRKYLIQLLAFDGMEKSKPDAPATAPATPAGEGEIGQ